MATPSKTIKKSAKKITGLSSEEMDFIIGALMVNKEIYEDDAKKLANSIKLKLRKSLNPTYKRRWW